MLADHFLQTRDFKRNAEKLLAAVRRSGGRTVAVSESEIEAAHCELARTGLYVEPTSASAAAALSKLVDARVVRPEETTVLVLTGAGLKATQRIGELMGILPEARAWSE